MTLEKDLLFTKSTVAVISIASGFSCPTPEENRPKTAEAACLRVSHKDMSVGQSQNKESVSPVLDRV